MTWVSLYTCVYISSSDLDASHAASLLMGHNRSISGSLNTAFNSQDYSASTLEQLETDAGPSDSEAQEFHPIDHDLPSVHPTSVRNKQFQPSFSEPVQDRPWIKLTCSACSRLYATNMCKEHSIVHFYCCYFSSTHYTCHALPNAASVVIVFSIWTWPSC